MQPPRRRDAEEAAEKTIQSINRPTWRFSRRLGVSAVAFSYRVVSYLFIRYNRPTMPDEKITLADVRHVAKLARLDLPEQKLQKFTQQLESILEYVAKINQVNMAGVDPMAHVLPISNVFREDLAQPGMPLDKVLQNAPETDGPFFKVPKVIGGDEDSAG